MPVGPIIKLLITTLAADKAAEKTGKIVDIVAKEAPKILKKLKK